jgi:hypothetical protein
MLVLGVNDLAKVGLVVAVESNLCFVRRHVMLVVEVLL